MQLRREVCTPDAGFAAQKAPENIWQLCSARTHWGALRSPRSHSHKKGEGKGWEREGKGGNRRGKVTGIEEGQGRRGGNRREGRRKGKGQGKRREKGSVPVKF